MENSTVQLIVTDSPGGSLTTATTPAAEVLLRLNRAVQRATIYPPDHPVVRQAVVPLVESMGTWFSQAERFVVFVSRHALLVAREAAPPESLPLPWLSSRLSERGLASLTLTRTLDEASAVGLVTWLARPATDVATSPELPGVLVAWRNYAQARFTEHRGAAAQDTDATLMWQRVVHGLAADWLDREGHAGSHEELDADRLADDPVALAKFVRNTLLTQEGTGIAAVATHVVSFGGRLSELSEPGRTLVRQKLARFITELAPELRGQLLRIVSTDSPEKLATIAQVIDELPRTLVLEVLQNIEVGAGQDPSAFISLLSKMVNLSASDSEMHRALGRSLTHAGLPEDILDQQDDRLRNALETLFNTPVDRASMSQEYRDQLDALTERRLAPSSYDHSHFFVPMRPDHLAVEVPRITLAVLASCASGTDAAALLERARAAGPALLAAGDVDSLALLANVASGLSSNASAAPEEIENARATLAFLQQPAVVDLLMKAVDDLTMALPLAAGDLFRACGLSAALQALDRLTSHMSPLVHSRVIGLLAQLDAAVLKVALMQARTQSRITSRVVLGLLCHQEIGHVVEIADLFSYDEEPELRLQAYRVLFATSLASRMERAMRRALDDVDPQVVDLAVTEICTRQETGGIRALGLLLGRVVDASLERAQRKAIAVLTRSGTPAAREALGTALAGRGRAFDRLSRHVSAHMAQGLEGFGDTASLTAAKTWRWSPAGLVSLVLRDRAVAA